MKSLIVEEKYNKKRLNTFLLDKFDGLSINTIYKALRKKDIRINNIKISENVIGSRPELSSAVYHFQPAILVISTS